MGQECPKNSPDTGGTLLKYVEPIALFASRRDGGSVRVQRFGDERVIAAALGHAELNPVDEVHHVVVELDRDIDGSGIDAVNLHGDGEVEDLDRAISALQAAREALLTTTVARA